MSKGYKYVTGASDSVRCKNGLASEHRMVAEKMLGRPLKREECVHHIDFNKRNNSPENLMVFKTVADHSAFHFGRKAVLDGDVYCCPDKGSQFKIICPVCGENHVSQGAKMCLACENKRKRRMIEQKCPKHVLERLICEKPFTEIGRMYGVSHAAVRKWCKVYGLPTKYWDVQRFKTSRQDISVRQSV